MIKRCTFVGVLIFLALVIGKIAEAQAPALLSPVERIAFSDDWRDTVERKVPTNGHVFVIARTGDARCAKITVSARESRIHVMLPMEVTVPSGRGGQTGTFYEALMPLNSDTCGMSPYRLIEWRAEKSGQTQIDIGTKRLNVGVRIKDRARLKRKPFFVGITINHLLKAHCGGYCPREGALGNKYAELLTAHGVQPIQGWARLPPIRNGRLDLDDGAEAGRSFRQLILDHAISGWIGFPRATYYKDPISYLQALEATVRADGLEGRAWVYAVDEPKVSDKLIKHLQLYRLFAPSVRVMVTTPYRVELAPSVDVFAPVYNWVKSGSAQKPPGHKEFWSYPSCMGSCGPRRRAGVEPHRKPGADTGFADFLIDRPAERLFAFFKDADRYGVTAGLYYETTEGFQLTNHGVDLFQDAWNYGGNGDGLLVYPGKVGQFGLKDDQPLPSFRLKLIRHALQEWW